MRASLSRVAVILAFISGLTACATRRLTCRDGDPNIVISPHGPGGAPFCNHDDPYDRVCTFAVCGLCPFIRSVGPQCGVCPEGRSLPWGAKVITVPVNEERVRRIATTRVTLRCLALATCNREHHQCTAGALTCVDGLVVGEGCDADQRVNGVCTFSFPYCKTCSPQPRETVVVPVGETRVIQRSWSPTGGIVQIALRCLAPP